MSEAEKQRGCRGVYLEEDNINIFAIDSEFFDSSSQLITITFPEFVFICSATRSTQICSVDIVYHPATRRQFHVASIADYLFSYRDVGLSQEGATKRIRADLAKHIGCDLLVRIVCDNRSGSGARCVTEEGLPVPVQDT